MRKSLTNVKEKNLVFPL